MEFLSKLGLPVIVTAIAAITVIYIISNIALQFVNKIIWDWVSKGRKRDFENNDNNKSGELVVVMKESHLKIEQQILRVLDVQNTQATILKDVLIQVKNIKISKFNDKISVKPIESISHRECLLLEDDEFTAPFLAELLQILGNHVHHAPTYSEAIKLVNAIKFDFAVVDYHLGSKETGVDFWNYCKENNYMISKSNGSAANIKIIVYSSGLESTPAGMTYVEKPIDIKMLQKTIERIVS